MGVETRRPGRPWATLKGDDSVIHAFINELRGLVDASGTSLQDIAAACRCSRTTVSKRLNGLSLPSRTFVEGLVRACTPRVEQVDARINAFLLWRTKATQDAGRSRIGDRPEPNGRQIHTHLIEAQAQTINAQRQLIAIHDELADAQRQLMVSARAETRAIQMVRMLHLVIHVLTRRIEELIREHDRHKAEALGEAATFDRTNARLSTTRTERERAQWQLQQAQEARRRATALADAAAYRISQLEYELNTTDDTAPATTARIDPPETQPKVQPLDTDDVLADATGALDRMQRMLDDQGEELDRIQRTADEPDHAVAAAALPLSEPAVNDVLAERDRIAGDLHDHVIQRLFATGMSLQGTVRRIDDPTVRSRVSRAVEQLDKTVRQIRTSVFDLASTDRSGSLRRRMLDIVEELSTETMHPHVRISGAVDTLVPDSIAQHATAVLREAMSNAIRHAHARSIVVTIEADTDLIINVVDDGVGIPESVARSGLLNIENRAVKCGGHAVIVPGPAGGTRLAWHVPLPPR